MALQGVSSTGTHGPAGTAVASTSAAGGGGGGGGGGCAMTSADGKADPSLIALTLLAALGLLAGRRQRKTAH